MSQAEGTEVQVPGGECAWLDWGTGQSGRLVRRVVGCGRKVMLPQGVHTLVPRTCKYVTLHGKRDSADVITLRNLRGGGYPGLSR